MMLICSLTVWIPCAPQLRSSLVPFFVSFPHSAYGKLAPGYTSTLNQWQRLTNLYEHSGLLLCVCQANLAWCYRPRRNPGRPATHVAAVRTSCHVSAGISGGPYTFTQKALSPRLLQTRRGRQHLEECDPPNGRQNWKQGHAERPPKFGTGGPPPARPPKFQPKFQPKNWVAMYRAVCLFLVDLKFWLKIWRAFGVTLFRILAAVWGGTFDPPKWPPKLETG